MSSSSSGTLWDGTEHQGELRHWSPESQTYATADILLRYLRDAWDLGEIVTVESFGCQSYRRVNIYHFTLHKGGMQLCIPVIENPIVWRLVREYGLTLAPEAPASEEVTSPSTRD